MKDTFLSWVIGLFLLPILVSEGTTPAVLNEPWMPAISVLAMMLFLVPTSETGDLSKEIQLALSFYAFGNFVLYLCALLLQHDVIVVLVILSSALLFALRTGEQAARLCLSEQLHFTQRHMWVTRFIFWTPALSIAGYLLLQTTSQPEIRFLPIAIGVLTPMVLHKFVAGALKDE